MAFTYVLDLNLSTLVITTLVNFRAPRRGSVSHFCLACNREFKGYLKSAYCGYCFYEVACKSCYKLKRFRAGKVDPKNYQCKPCSNKLKMKQGSLPGECAVCGNWKDKRSLFACLDCRQIAIFSALVAPMVLDEINNRKKEDSE